MSELVRCGGGIAAGLYRVELSRCYKDLMDESHDYAAFMADNRSKIMASPFDHYQTYMEQNRAKFPSNVFDFAVDINRHDLASPHSLHDAWMTSITIKENRNPTRPFNPEPTIEIVLLGPMHDRNLILTYTGVFAYTLKGSLTQWNYRDTYQGDVLWHRVVPGQEGLVIHHYQFASDSSIAIESETFTCIEEILETE